MEEIDKKLQDFMAQDESGSEFDDSID